MPFADARDLAEDMRNCPPVHLLVAAYLGVKGKASDDTMTPDELAELKGKLNG
jgi:hypothetical protein